MLIEFSVENFRSIKEEQTLSLLATKLKEHPGNIISAPDDSKYDILRSAIIYGANASGKTNILKALSNFVALVILSTDLKVGKKIPAYQPYRLDKSCLGKPSKFQIEFIGPKNIRYRYLVSFTEDEFLSEELFYYPKKQEALLFSRLKGEKIKFGNYLTGRKKSIEAELLPNNLFLSKAANSNLEQLQDIYLYFVQNFNFQMKDHIQSLIADTSTTRRLAESDDKHFMEKINIFLKFADTGISSLKIVKNDFEFDFKKNLPDGFPAYLAKALETQASMRPTFSHLLYENNEEIGTVDFDISEESDGTTKLYSLASDIITSLINGEIFVIDEIDNSLHPHITSLIVSLFNNPKTNKKNAQLITATHDASLLNQNLIRRDQVWFTNKKKDGSTQLYSLVEFDKNEVRAKTPFSSWYLSGRFNAVPLIDKNIYSIFENCDAE